MGRRILVVGAGFYGATCARELADAGHDVLVIDKKSHVGGHCHTEWVREAGCYRHVYGPHIFHTDSDRVWRYVNRFAEFNGFINRPKVNHRGSIYSFPINLMTLYQGWGVTTPDEARERLRFATLAFAAIEPANMEEWCLKHMGRELYKLFIEGYTQKQWGRHPRELPPSIIKRIPIRFNFDDNYFNHRYQGIPTDGYTALIGRMLEHDRIAIELGIDFGPSRDFWLSSYDRVIYTGPIDEFFGHALGFLEYRTLRFESVIHAVPDYQGNAVINYTDASVPYTRVVEHKHFDPRRPPTEATIVTREYPEEWRPGLDQFYPVGTAENEARFAHYQALAAKSAPNVSFGGRLGMYRYMDMDQTVACALDAVHALGAA